jgi:hypothetical protein
MLATHASMSMSGGGVGGMTNGAGPVRRSRVDAADVADEREAALRIEVGDVMRGVTRCVGHLETPSGRVDFLAARERRDVRRRHRHHRPPQPVHVGVAVDARGAGHQLRRVDHVRRAAFVDEHADVRMLAHQRASRAGMIEVDVRQQDRLDLARRHAAGFEAGDQVGQAAGRPGIDQRDAAGAVEHGGRDHLRRALKTEIYVPQTWGENSHNTRKRGRCTTRTCLLYAGRSPISCRWDGLGSAP